MAATQTAVSDGTLNIIEVSIPYFEEDDISVALDLDTALTAGTDYLWTSSTSIQFQNTTHTPGGLVPAGVTVLLRRGTKDDEMYNIFDGGAGFSRAALDENFKQLLYREQEFSEGLGINGLHSNLDMNGYRITNAGDAVDDGDLLPLGQADERFVNRSGDNMTGPLAMGGQKVTGVGQPTLATDAARLAEVQAEAASRQAADAALQAQLDGTSPPAGSAFSVISWHAQTIENSMVIPPNVNAWSFGPKLTIAAGQAVTIGEGSFWTIAEGASTQEGPLVAEFPDHLDLGVLT